MTTELLTVPPYSDHHYPAYYRKLSQRYTLQNEWSHLGQPHGHRGRYDVLSYLWLEMGGWYIMILWMHWCFADAPASFLHLLLWVDACQWRWGRETGAPTEHLCVWIMNHYEPPNRQFLPGIIPDKLVSAWMLKLPSTTGWGNCSTAPESSSGRETVVQLGTPPESLFCPRHPLSGSCTQILPSVEQSIIRVIGFQLLQVFFPATQVWPAAAQRAQVDKAEKD